VTWLHYTRFSKKVANGKILPLMPIQSIPFWTPIIIQNPLSLTDYALNIVEETFYCGGKRAHITGSNVEIVERSPPLLKIALIAAAALFSRGRMLLLVLFVAKVIYRYVLGQNNTASSLSTYDQLLAFGNKLKSKNIISNTQAAKMNFGYGKYLFSLSTSGDVQIEHYVKLLGRGGFGKVSEIKNLKNGTCLALKVALPPKEYKNDSECLQKAEKDLEQEASNLRLLNPDGKTVGIQHPPLGPMLTIIKVDELFRIIKKRKGIKVMKYGGSLDKLQVHRFSVKDRFDILLQIALGTEHYRKHSLVHSDLKPANMLFMKTPSRTVAVISDWGSAWNLTNCAEGAQTYTPHYVTKKDLKDIHSAWTTLGKHWSGKKGDIYSLGVTFFELLTGEIFSDKLNIQGRLSLAGLGGPKYDKFIQILKRMVQPPEGMVTAMLDTFRGDKQGRPEIDEIIKAITETQHLLN
jgi:hypothetical protein